MFFYLLLFFHYVKDTTFSAEQNGREGEEKKWKEDLWLRITQNVTIAFMAYNSFATLLDRDKRMNPML